MRGAATAVVVLVAAALGACGGGGSGGDDNRSEDEKQVDATLKAALTTKDDPDVCTRLMTQRFVEQLAFEMGQSAVTTCEEGLKRSAAKSVSVKGVRVHGPRASADVVRTGGELPFTAMRIGLRKASGQWRLDRVKTATVDRSLVSRVISKAAPSSTDARTRACIVREFNLASDKALARSLLKGDLVPFLLPYLVCGIRAGRAGLPESAAACAARRTRRELLHGEVGRRLRGAHASELESILAEPEVLRILRHIGTSCGRSFGAAARPPILDSR
jgi:hypothetical protein